MAATYQCNEVRLSTDGKEICAMIGPDPVQGVAGYGLSVHDALRDLADQLLRCGVWIEVTDPNHPFNSTEPSGSCPAPTKMILLKLDSLGKIRNLPALRPRPSNVTRGGGGSDKKNEQLPHDKRIGARIRYVRARYMTARRPRHHCAVAHPRPSTSWSSKGRNRRGLRGLAAVALPGRIANLLTSWMPLLTTGSY
jgi:hypothetical protein